MRFTLRVRYSECDMQRVVHNSVYLRWCDDVADDWFEALGVGLGEDEWDVMVKAAQLVWSAPARVRDEVDIDVSVVRFGTTSFDVSYVGSRAGELLFEATITYVAVTTGTTTTLRVPDAFRVIAGGA